MIMTKREKIQQAMEAHNVRKNFLFMVIVGAAAVLVGCVAVIYNHMFIWGAQLARERFFENPFTVFLVVPSFFLLSAWLCKRFAPGAAGGGPDQVISALQRLNDPKQLPEEEVKEFLSFKVLLVKIISSVVCIMGGGALGREGPVVQISASIFVMVAKHTKKSLPHLDLRTWIIAGAAAGFAAAFNTPLAAVIFAVEELSEFHFDKQFSEFKTKAFMAVILAGVTSQLLTGDEILFQFPAVHFMWQIQVVVVLVGVGVACGGLASLLRRFIGYTGAWRNRVQGYRWYLFPIVTGLVVALVSFYLGKNTFGAGTYTIKEALESSVVVLGVQDFFGRFINIIASAASGCAGGLLLPALALGAGVGSMGGMLIDFMDARVFIAAGMAAFLGALLNAPLTAAVLVLEVTGQRELIFPLFLASIIAAWIRKHCDKAVGAKGH